MFQWNICRNKLHRESASSWVVDPLPSRRSDIIPGISFCVQSWHAARRMASRSCVCLYGCVSMEDMIIRGSFIGSFCVWSMMEHRLHDECWLDQTHLALTCTTLAKSCWSKNEEQSRQSCPINCWWFCFKMGFDLKTCHIWTNCSEPIYKMFGRQRIF